MKVTMSGKLDEKSVLAIVQAHIEKIMKRKVAKIFVKASQKYDLRGESCGAELDCIEFELAPEELEP